MRVAVVGLGHMGAGIARNLDRAGLLFGAFDADAGAFARVGLTDRVSDLPVHVLRDQADMIVFAVPSTADIVEALGDSQGRDGQIVIDVTTSAPAASQALDAILSAQGQHLVDAAMTGGAAGADAGELTLMVGGSAPVISRCAPVFDAIAARVFHLGPVGAGHAMKLVHNMILHGHFLATCEGLRMAERAGLDVAQAVDVLNAGNARSFVSEVRFPRDILSGSMNARSVVGNLEKDLGLAVKLAASLGANAPFGGLAHDVLAQAVTQGMARTDFSQLFPNYDTVADGLEQK